MDIWVAMSASNAEKVAEVLRKFGFSSATVKPEIFEKSDQIIRMGVLPICIDVITSASGVNFADCFAKRGQRLIDGVEVNIIHIDDLKKNKKASGRAKDLNDLEKLP